MYQLDANNGKIGYKICDLSEVEKVVQFVIDETAKEFILKKGGKVTVYTTIYPGC